MTNQAQVADLGLCHADTGSRPVPAADRNGSRGFVTLGMPGSAAHHAKRLAPCSTRWHGRLSWAI